MAAAAGRALWVPLAALLALLAVAGASTLTTFDAFNVSTGGCTGNVQVISCGNCANIRYHGGYYFIFTGGAALFYQGPDCGGNFLKDLADDEWNCSPFTYGSVAIGCSATTSPWDITAPQ